MNHLAKIDPRKDHSNKLKYLLINRIDQLGNFSFADDSWYYKKKHIDSLPKGSYTITFHQIPEVYKSWVKYYALHSTISPSSIFKKCIKIALFLKFLERNYKSIELTEVTRKHVNAFEHELRLTSVSQTNMQFTYASLQDFFLILSDFPETPNLLPTKQINPFKQAKSNIDKRMPEISLRAWDKVLKDENIVIPLEFRTLYWIIRSFPNRITEVLSMKRDCLKTFYSEYVINIPSFKQSGGYGREIIKPIPVLYEGHGKYVIDLIRRLQKQTEDLMKLYNTPPSVKQDFLFTVRHWSFKNKDGKIGPVYSKKQDSIWNWTGAKVNEFFKQLAHILNIREKNGELIIPTTHQFRHHAVSDRLYMVGYSIEQVRKLTGHKNEAMTKHYTHHMIEKHKNILVSISGLRNSHESPYEFKGKIINLDERTVFQLSKDQRRYLTWEANGKKGVGICSDISGCNPQGTSVHFECYACNWFLPKLEYFDDYKAEYAYWQDVIDRTSLDPNRAAHTENAIRNVSYIERILEICNYGLEQYKRTQVAELTQNAEFKYQWE